MWMYCHPAESVATHHRQGLGPGPSGYCHAVDLRNVAVAACACTQCHLKLPVSAAYANDNLHCDACSATCLQSQVEDTKGNNGDQGVLTITNLRLMWVSRRSSSMNLSVGYNCIVSINIKQAASRLKGQCPAFHTTDMHAPCFICLLQRLRTASARSRECIVRHSCTVSVNIWPAAAKFNKSTSLIASKP